MEPGRRDAERRDKPALEVPDQRRHANQAELELPIYKRVSLRPRGYDALVHPLDVANCAATVQQPEKIS
jgi:hypothetical protein